VEALYKIRDLQNIESPELCYGLACIAEGLFLMACILIIEKDKGETVGENVKFRIYEDLYEKGIFRHIYFQFHPEFIQNKTHLLYKKLLGVHKDALDYSPILQKMKHNSKVGGRRKKMSGGLGYQFEYRDNGDAGNGMIEAKIRNDQSQPSSQSGGSNRKIKLKKMNTQTKK
jgi:hypothetical protein